jgi:transposase
MTTSPFLPLPTGLSIECVAPTTTAVQVWVQATSSTATCPACGTCSRRVRSSYVRTAADVPSGGQRVIVQVRVRRFVCHQPTCSRRIFAEQFPEWLPPRARQTTRRRQALVTLGLATSGALAARVARHLGMPTSPSTINRAIMRLPSPDAAAPIQVGIDDFALRRGHRYGTIVVDLREHCVLDLLADREATTAAQWLQTHPSVSWVSRDRGGAYADGVRQSGLPIEQVADRWHVLANLGDAIERMAERLQWSTLLRHQHAPAHPPPARESVPEPIPKPVGLPLSPRQHERQQAILALHQRGVSQRAIAQTLHLARGTVRRYLHGYTLQRPRTRISSLLDPFRSQIFAHWQAGRDAMQIFHEIRKQGYRGGSSIVRRLVTTWRKTQPPLTPPPPFSTRRLRWLLVRPSDHLTVEEQSQRLMLLATIPDACTVFSLYHRFWGMLHHQQPVLLLPWLHDAETSGMAELRGFAAGIQRDLSAVINGMTSPLSQGQTEGQITKLKLMKRQMYGRAGLPLLRQRLLHPV